MTAVSSVSVATWNATGIMSSSSYLCDLLDSYDIDIIGISEHWLFQYDLHFLDLLHTNYISHSTSDPDLFLPSNRRVGKGGLAFLWKKQLNGRITPLDIRSRYIIGIEIMIDPDQYLYLLQVYLPCKNHVSEIYRNCLEELESLFCQYNSNGIVIIMGDFNTELPSRYQNHCKMDRRGVDLVQFMLKYNLVAVDTLPYAVGQNLVMSLLTVIERLLLIIC
jgi:exonuclease III